MFFKNKLIQSLSILYLLVPIIIFLLNWIKAFISYPLIILLIYSTFHLIKKLPNDSIHFNLKDKKNLLILFLILIWVILSGIGGFSWQNRWDHMFRNALFKDLFNYAWPVINTSFNDPKLLTYYIGFWLPSALIGKLFNSLSIGYLFQLIWGYLGVVFALLLIFNYLKTIKLRVLLIFIFYSGLDILAYFWTNRSTDMFYLIQNLINFQHIELTLEVVNASSNTTLLFWLYNQIIPFWIGFMLLINQKQNQFILLVFSLLILYSPFPALSLVPLIIYNVLTNQNLKNLGIIKYFIVMLKTSFTLENISGFLILLIVALYYKSNFAVNKIYFLTPSIGLLTGILVFFITEYFVFFPLFIKNNIKNYKYWILFITTFFFSFILMGKCCDFAWRTSISLSFYTMLLVLTEIVKLDNLKQFISKYILIILLIGSITPLLEISRTIDMNIKILSNENGDTLLSNNLPSVFDVNNPLMDSFTGSSYSLFSRYLLK